MVIYKITLKPLMPYFFGGEHTFSMNPSKERSPYFIVSEPVPSQTTLFGMLRYEILKEAQALSGIHTPEQKQVIRNKQIDLVGEQSFSFRPQNQLQAFGKINRISPAFIAYEEKSFFPTPLAFVLKDKECEQIILEETDQNVYLSNNIRRVPFVGDSVLNDKCYPVGGFVAWDAEKGEASFKRSEDFITSEIRIGIDARRTSPERNNENCFFKRSFCNLNKQAAFNFYAYLEEALLPQNDIVYMGQGKSAFAFEAIQIEGTDPFADETEKLKNLINVPDKSYKVYYAVSDCYFPSGLPETIWKMIDTRPSHNLETNYDKITSGDFRAHFSKNKEQQIFIRKGSVFFTEKELPEVESSKDNMKIIGMNHLVLIGG